MVPEFNDLLSMLNIVDKDGNPVHIDLDRPAREIPDSELPFTECDKQCDDCLTCDDIDGYEVGEDFDDDDYAPPMWGIPDIEHIIFSDPATIVFWDDGTKTVVKVMKGERFEKYAGFMAACMKKMFGSTSRAKAIMKELATEQVKNEKVKKPAGIKVPDLTQAFNEVIANRESAEEAVNEAFAR